MEDFSQDEKDGVITFFVIVLSSLTLYTTLPIFNGVFNQKTEACIDKDVLSRLFLLLAFSIVAAYCAFAFAIFDTVGTWFCMYNGWNVRLGWNLEPVKRQSIDEAPSCEED